MWRTVHLSFVLKSPAQYWLKECQPARGIHSCLMPFCKSLKWTFLVPLDPDGRPKPFRVTLTYPDLCSSLLLNDLPVNCTGNEANAVTVSASPDAD